MDAAIEPWQRCNNCTTNHPCAAHLLKDLALRVSHRPHVNTIAMSRVGWRGPGCVSLAALLLLALLLLALLLALTLLLLTGLLLTSFALLSLLLLLLLPLSVQ